MKTEKLNLRLTHIPQSLIHGSVIKLGILETSIGKAVVCTEAHAQDSNCSCGKFIIFTDGERRTLSVPCTTCTGGLRLTECEALFGALAIMPGDWKHTSSEFVPGFGRGVIRFYSGSIEEVKLDENQVREDLARMAFDAQI